MAKKKIYLLIGLGVLLVLALSLAWLLREDTRDTGADSSVQTSELAVINTDQDVVSMQVQNQAESYIILPAEDSTEASPTWKIDSLRNAPQYQTKYNDLAALMQQLTVEQKLNHPSSLDAYGLDHPATITATYADGSKRTVSVGNLTPDQQGYYCMVDGDETIYVLSATHGAKWLRKAMDYVDLTLTPLLETTTYATEGSGESTATNITLNISEIVLENRGSVSTIINQDNTLCFNGKALDGTVAQTLENAISSLTAETAVAIDPSADQLKTYGLDQPSMIVRYTVSGTTYTLKIGAGIETEPDPDDIVQVGGISSYYVQLDGRPVVYTMAKDSLPWLELELATAD